ncbi:TonB-dependent receptor [Novosphingobium aerophilum]|uniref:TonB-dependent receptor n=1 Tax=Novosphingobium TaxID=165696 RepID=UPI0012C89C5E|nr:MULTISPECIES: TonB-dependent receptor [unclassified Novosphingobium]MPS70215.1 TonB-dependent receptor [Novosphingobium sp.]WRT94814.1 TonB-dependent receptor [Novosphingobium sp. RL4]
MRKHAVGNTRISRTSKFTGHALRGVSGLALAGALGVSLPAYAQTSSEDQGAVAEEPAKKPIDDKTAEKIITTANDIVVVGTRASLQSATNRKREASTIVDSIVADDIASFPDKNIGDSLARITGVQLTRDFGEGTAVSIRGVEPDLNRVEINGVSQVSATGSRAGDFRELATELVKSIDVYKGYAADLTEGGIGGTVRVETRKPLDLKAPLMTGVVSYQNLDTAETWKPRMTFVAGTPKFLIDGLGVLVNVTYSDVDTRQDYISNTNWSRLADFDHSTEKTVANPLYANYNTYESCAGVGGVTTSAATANRLACETQFFDWAPTVPRYRSWVRNDKRISGDLALQYQIAPNFRAYGQVQINKRNQNLQDTNYSVDLTRVERFNLDPALPAGANGGTSRRQVQLGTSTVNENHVVTSVQTALNAVNIGTVAVPNWNGAANIVGVQRRDFSYDQDSKYFTGGFRWDLNRLHIDFMGSHAKATTVSESNLISLGTSVAGITVDRNNEQGIPVFTFPSEFDPADPAVYSDFTRTGANGQVLPVYGPALQYRPSQASNTEDQLKFDADWEIDHPIVSKFEFGGQFRKQKYVSYNGGGTRLIDPATLTYQQSANVSYTTQIQDNPAQIRNGNTWYLTPAQYQSLISAVGGTLGGAPLFSGLKNAPSGIPSNIAFPNFDADVLSQYYDLSGFDQDLVRNADGLSQIPAYLIKETVYAGYIMADIDTEIFGMRLTGNAGLRWTQTKDQGLGTNISRVTRTTATGGTETVVIAAQEARISNTYTDFLPAFNANLAITPDLSLRANYAKNLARPRPTDLVPNINCLDDQTLTGAEDVCTAGNPDLKPYRADQWEVNLAWYPNADTMISLGYYKKYESSFVIPNVVRSGVDLFHDGITYTVRQAVNGYGALLDGIEVSGQTVFTFLPQPFDGLGLTGNMTYARAIRTNLTNSATGQELKEYPGLSKYTYNASVFYDKGFLNARLSYNYRSKWLSTVLDAANGNNPLYRKAEGYLDGKVTLRFPKYHFNVFFEMQNINKEYSKVYINKDMPVDLYYPGRRMFIGVQAKL